MANISLKTLITEAEDFKARSKETGKLVHFKSKDSYDSALKAGTHEDPKAEKDKTAKASTKSNDMFGGDYAKDRGGEPKSDGMATVNSIAASTGLRATAVAGWADENGVNLSKVSDALKSKKLKPMDFMTAVSGNPGNKYAKDIIKKYSNNSVSTSQPKSDNGLGWGPETDRTPAVSLPKKASQLNYKHAEVLEKAVNAATGLNGYVDTDDNTDAIMFTASSGMAPTYTLYFGGNDDYGKPDEFRVSLLPTYGNDPENIGEDVDKTFKSAEDAMKFMIAVAKKYKKQLEMDDDDTNESTKLTKMIKR
jgi:hypothetical protein